jgi:hypothetical protein
MARALRIQAAGGWYHVTARGNAVGGIDYRSVGAAVNRFGSRVSRDKQLRQLTNKIETHLQKAEM